MFTQLGHGVSRHCYKMFRCFEIYFISIVFAFLNACDVFLLIANCSSDP